MKKIFKKKLINDYLGLEKSIEVPYIKKITGGFKVDIQKYSGLVAVKDKSIRKKTLRAWGSKLFSNKFSGNFYNPRIPAVIARLTYVFETINSQINIKNKKICDVGGGDGYFLELLKKKTDKKNLIGVELSKSNCEILKKKKLRSFHGSFEQFYKNNKRKFDLITFNWTLCNTSNPLELIDLASKKVNKNGYVAITESSRILVPFKKPIQLFIPKEDPAYHPYFFSKNSLMNILLLNNLKPIFINKYIDTDYLLIIAKKSNNNLLDKIKLDDFKKVKKFFSDWYNESKKYSKDLY